MESEDSGSSLREGFTEPSGGTHVESEDSRSRLPEGSGKASGGTVTKTQGHDASRLPEASKQSIAHEGRNVKLKGVKFSELETERASTKEESGLTSVLKTEQGGEAPKPLSKNRIAQTSGESKRTDEAVKKTVRFQKAEQAAREARGNQQRQASRVLFYMASAGNYLPGLFAY